MEGPTEEAEALSPMVSERWEEMREDPNLNQYLLTFAMRRRAAKHSESWYHHLTSPPPLSPPML
jgi:hypothetical protein